MAHPLRRRHLSRRTFLRGTGTALALPFLDAHVPAMRSASRPVRAVWVFAPNGIVMDAWRPRRTGTAFELPFLLEPFAPLRDRCVVLSGLEIDAGWAHGDGPGDHARSCATFLTCTHPVKTGGADIRVGPSIDQLVAAELGARTSWPSLELGLEGGASAGVCDSGYSCAYSNNVAWRTATTPVAKETEPRAVFERLFGDPAEQLDAAARAARRARLKSVLDTVLDDVKALQRGLPADDRRKVDEYLDAVREVEQRLDRLDREDAERRADLPSPEVLERHADDGGFVARLRTMYDLLALALATDRTRIATLMLGNGGSNRSYAFVGAPGGHHELSHHGGNADRLAGIRRINRFHTEEFARFLTTLAQRDDGGPSLLDQSIVLFGSGISDGNRHNHDDLPVLLCGAAGGRLRSRGHHLALPARTPMADVHLAIAHLAGARLASFADARGPLEELV
ncbi:MAG: DUF1552 domain-containing protein [Planctomycetes bacterium]|nr:DUF1552 domain-containing protein [Planctomycetota bacterium]